MSIKKRFSQLNNKRHNIRENLKDKPFVFLLFRSAVIAVGFFLIILGLVMFVTPGPGMLALFAGLSLLATELPWAHRIVRRLKLLWRRFMVHFWKGKIRRTFPSKSQKNI